MSASNLFCLGDVIEIEHNYARCKSQTMESNVNESNENPKYEVELSEQMTRRSTRPKKQPDRFNLAGVNHCVVCKVIH